MSRKQKKTLLSLVGILTALVIVLAVVITVKSRRAQAEQEALQQAAAEGVITQDQAYSAVTYSNGSTTLSFRLDEGGKWIWADDPDFPLDDATVTSILDLLSNLKPQQTITDGDTLEAYGLDQPAATLTATVAETGGTLTIALGNTTTDGSSYYMLMNQDEETVYIISDSLYQQMSVPIYDMCLLPAAPQLTADTLTSVTVEGAAATVLTAQRPEDAAEDAEAGDDAAADGEETGSAVTWRSGGANVTSDPTVTALLEELAGLTIEKCVDFKPTDEAVEICGFAAPAATLTAKYLGDGGTEQTFVLTVGSAVPGGSGGETRYYVRTGDDTTIYQMDGSGLETLLAVAAGGLEG
jgi:type II secretory pathway pseudopilin PulG